MRRQTPGWTFPEPTLERAGAAMAHRRGLLDRRVLRLVMVVMALAASLAGALLVTVQVTRLRTSVAELEDRHRFARFDEAGVERALCLSTWYEEGTQSIEARVFGLPAELNEVRPRLEAALQLVATRSSQ